MPSTGKGGLPKDVFIVAVLVLTCTASFMLGYLAAREGGEGGGIWIEDLSAGGPSAAASAKALVPAPAPAAAGEAMYVASKNGTKYHLPWCTGAKAIKEENKVWFDSKEAAQAAGYSPAANCKGI